MGAVRRHDYFAPDTFGRAVQDHLGDDVMLRLRKALGGTELRIPVRDAVLLNGHPLVQAIGRADALRMAAVFGGERVYVPLLRENGAYLSAAEAGLSNPEIAQQLGVSVRHVRRVLACEGVQNPNHQQRVTRALRPGAAARHPMTMAE
ncbi:MAG: helix-turn-helix domain-containing protein [Gemmobacter sp.]|jgi:hypothetical protein|nr:helix-turn-helix domain-containing protein [Gemmobacter sp.]